MVLVVREVKIKLAILKDQIEVYPSHRIIFIADREDPQVLIENIHDALLVEKIIKAINEVDYEKIFCR